MEEKLKRLRSLGWAVAIHNDYMVGGTPMTFWLFTHPTGKFVKGEGYTDEDALDECIQEVSIR